MMMMMLVTDQTDRATRPVLKHACLTPHPHDGIAVVLDGMVECVLFGPPPKHMCGVLEIKSRRILGF